MSIRIHLELIDTEAESGTSIFKKFIDIGEGNDLDEYEIFSDILDAAADIADAEVEDQGRDE